MMMNKRRMSEASYIERQICIEICNGNIKIKLPSIRVMAKIFNVNHNTISKVYDELKKKKLTYSVKGKGTYITENIEVKELVKKEMTESIVKAYIDNMKQMNYKSDQIIALVDKCIRSE